MTHAANETPVKIRNAAAKRALAEAADRRRQAELAQKEAQIAEQGGPKGPEPTRYGDWERKGIISDF